PSRGDRNTVVKRAVLRDVGGGRCERVSVIVVGRQDHWDGAGLAGVEGTDVDSQLVTRDRQLQTPGRVAAIGDLRDVVPGATVGDDRQVHRLTGYEGPEQHAVVGAAEVTELVRHDGADW